MADSLRCSLEESGIIRRCLVFTDRILGLPASFVVISDKTNKNFNFILY